MKLRQFLRGFTLIELLVVITIIALLAGIAMPVFGPIIERAHRMADLAQGQQIYLGLVGFAADNDGQFPNTAYDSSLGGPGQSAISNANEAFQNICPQYIPQEKVFYVAGSAWTPHKPDENTSPGNNLVAGENHYGYVGGLQQTSPGQWPLIADGWSANKGVYTNITSQPGGVWKGQWAVVINVDGSGQVLKCTPTYHVMGLTGGSGPADIFLQTTDPAWLTSGTLYNPEQ